MDYKDSIKKFCLLLEDETKIGYHRTLKQNAEKIKEQGLKVNQSSNLTTGGDWSFEHYGVKPVFISLEYDKFSTEGDVVLTVDITGLDVVADLPSLVDHGAIVEEDHLWWEEGQEPKELEIFLEDGAVYIEDLLVPDSNVANAAISLTKTLAVLEDIEPNRIS